MELFYCKGGILNFGDDMNEWFWDEIFPDFHDIAPERTMFGIGSILWRSNVEEFDNIVIMGSGTGVGILPDTFPQKTLFQFVRGPRTARQFGLSADQHISDPACCTPLLAGMEPPEHKHNDVLLVPHAGTANLPLNWDRIASEAGLRCVTPSAESRSVIREIAGARLVLAESMHAAILADAYRVPWIAVSIRPNVWSFKWEDWAASVETDLQMHSALDGLKSVYGTLRGLRERVRGLGKALRPAKSDQRVATFAEGDSLGKSRDYYLDPTEKDMVRRQVTRFAPLVERALIADMARLSKKTPQLSPDAVLADRQRRIFEKIDATRTLLGAERRQTV